MRAAPALLAAAPATPNLPPMSDLFPPFAPDADEPRKRLFKPVPFRVIAPNLITLIALCLGLTAIRLAYEGRLEPAVIAIVVAAMLDGVDGRVARLLKGTSRFGAELDSLADFVNFGVAPALILYSFVLHHAEGARLDRRRWSSPSPWRCGWRASTSCSTIRTGPNGRRTSSSAWRRRPARSRRSCRSTCISSACRSEPAVAPLVLVYVLGLAFLMVSTDPDLFGQDHGQARAAPLGAADLRR